MHAYQSFILTVYVSAHKKTEQAITVFCLVVAFVASACGLAMSTSALEARGLFHGVGQTINALSTDLGK